MKYTIEVTKVAACPIAGSSVGFYDATGSLWCINSLGCAPTYVGMTASLLPESAATSTPPPNIAPACGMSEDGVLRLVAIIANNGAGTIKDILK